MSGLCDMDKSVRQNKNLSLAGLILSVIPIALWVIFIISENTIVLYTCLICGAILPIAGLILSIAGTVSARKHGKNGSGAGIAGIIISSIGLLSAVVYALMLIIVIIPAR